MQDPFGRTIDYLRVSLTDRCNFRCVYCMPEEGFPFTPKDEQLTLDETARIIRIAASLGMRKVRLTGGEPLLRKELPEFVESLQGAGIEDLSVTTNGHFLKEMAAPLAKAGMHRVNVSLDTLHEDRFVAIARRGSIDHVLAGIEAAKSAGLTPIKINCVAMAGVNDDEFADFAAWTLKEEIHVRFIELMPMRWNLDEGAPIFDPQQAHGKNGLLPLVTARGGMLSDLDMRRKFISAAAMREKIEAVHGPLQPAEVKTNGPARSYRLPGAKGTVGFISQISFDFCERCNRLRLTHDGFLRPCLMSDGEMDLRSPLRAGATDDDLRQLIEDVVRVKPERHYLAEGQRVTGRGMSQIGG